MLGRARNCLASGGLGRREKSGPEGPVQGPSRLNGVAPGGVGGKVGVGPLVRSHQVAHRAALGQRGEAGAGLAGRGGRTQQLAPANLSKAALLERRGPAHTDTGTGWGQGGRVRGTLQAAAHRPASRRRLTRATAAGHRASWPCAGCSTPAGGQGGESGMRRGSGTRWADQRTCRARRACSSAAPEQPLLAHVWYTQGDAASPPAQQLAASPRTP